MWILGLKGLKYRCHFPFAGVFLCSLLWNVSRIMLPSRDPQRDWAFSL